MSTTWHTRTHSAAETQQIAARLAQLLAAGDVLWLSGNLGAGKTTFTQGLGRALGIGVPVNSPTFVLIREYHGRLPLYHIDLYRLDGAREIANLGLGDYLSGDGVCVVEWAERLATPGVWPGLYLRLEPVGETQRSLHFIASGERAERLLAALIAGEAGSIAGVKEHHAARD